MGLTRVFAALAPILVLFAGTTRSLATAELEAIEIGLVAEDPVGDLIIGFARSEAMPEFKYVTPLGQIDSTDVGEVK